ncbi:MAG: MBL fold metallo-hydrolase [Methyloligellaceae bacterium]
MSNISFNQEINFEYFVASEVAPNVRRMVANNGNAMTFKGTNSYIVGKGNVAVIDPGPEIAEHREALLKELDGETITHIILTHTHVDHSAGIAALQEATGAKTVGYGQRDQNKRPSVIDKEFIDWDFNPDIVIQDGDVFEGDGWELEAIHTPGHAPDHLCLAMSGNDVLFSGDHVMAWNTSVVAPPEGHMGDYMTSLEKLLKRTEETYFPGHGGRITTPSRVVKAYLVHRTWREAAVLKCVRAGNHTIAAMLPSIYPDALTGGASLKSACEASLLAHLEYLLERDFITNTEAGRPKLTGHFEAKS